MRLESWIKGVLLENLFFLCEEFKLRFGEFPKRLEKRFGVINSFELHARDQ